MVGDGGNGMRGAPGGDSDSYADAAGEGLRACECRLTRVVSESSLREERGMRRMLGGGDGISSSESESSSTARRHAHAQMGGVFWRQGLRPIHIPRIAGDLGGSTDA